MLNATFCCGSIAFSTDLRRKEDDMNSESASDRLKYIAAVVIYGTIGPLLRYVDFPSELVVMCRGIIGSLTIFLFLKIQGKGLDKEAIRKNLRWLIPSGIALGLNWVFLFAAYIHTTVAIASLCNYLAPVIIVLLSPVLLREQINPKKLICVGAAFVGIILVSGIVGGSVAEVNFKGIGLGLLAAAGFVALVFFNKKMKDISAYDKSVLQLSVSALTVLPYVIFNNLGKPITVNPRSVLITLMLGLIHTGLAYVLYFGSLGKLSVQTVAILGYLEPVISVLASAIVLKEHMGIAGWIGAVLIIVAAAASEII